MVVKPGKTWVAKQKYAYKWFPNIWWNKICQFKALLPNIDVKLSLLSWYIFRPKSTSFKVFFWKLQVPRKPNRNIQQQLPPHQPWQPNKIFGQEKIIGKKNLLSFWSHICAIFVIFSITKYTSIYLLYKYSTCY